MRKQQSTQEELESYEDQRLLIHKSEKTIKPLLLLLPVVVLIATALLSKGPDITIALTSFAVLFSYITYSTSYGSHFENLKYDVKRAMISKFMKTFYPKTIYNYYATKQKVKEFVTSADLIRGVNAYEEEDVITGHHLGSYFYFSEIHLKKKVDDVTFTKFKGLLFKIQLPGRNFPKSKIQSKKGLFNKLFGDFYHNKAHDIFINSEDPQKLEEEIKPLLPFIAHLSKEQGDIRLSTQGEQITILMSSDMKFLDDPEPHITKSFLKESYKNNIAKQMNTLLFIVDAFINNANTTELEERFELKQLIKLREQS